MERAGGKGKVTFHASMASHPAVCQASSGTSDTGQDQGGGGPLGGALGWAQWRSLGADKGLQGRGKDQAWLALHQGRTGAGGGRQQHGRPHPIGKEGRRIAGRRWGLGLRLQRGSDPMDPGRGTERMEGENGARSGAHTGSWAAEPPGQVLRDGGRRKQNRMPGSSPRRALPQLLLRPHARACPPVPSTEQVCPGRRRIGLVWRPGKGSARGDGTGVRAGCGPGGKVTKRAQCVTRARHRHHRRQSRVGIPCPPRQRAGAMCPFPLSSAIPAIRFSQLKASCPQGPLSLQNPTGSHSRAHPGGPGLLSP